MFGGTQPGTQQGELGELALISVVITVFSDKGRW